MKILVLSPHVDDAEICMGGFIKDHAEHCHVVFYSKCDIPNVEHEVSKSMKALGVKHWYIKDHKRRYMNMEKQLILQDMIEMGRFDYVFAPHPDDYHQDHKTISEAAIRAFGRKASLHFYLWPPNMLTMPARLFHILTPESLDAKVKAVLSYRSQVKLRPVIFNEQYLTSQAIAMGSLIECKYAEAFDVYRGELSIRKT